jgi:predicted nucleotidyltransferase
MYSNADLETMATILRSHIQNMKALYLFGSYAQGTAREDSDVDVAVIMEDRPDWREKNRILNAVRKEMSERGYRVDIILKLSRDFELDREVPVTFSHTIAHQGKLLWKKSA